MVASNKTDVSINAVDIPHEGPEEYFNIWQKVRSIWDYVYDNYYDDYDWFHIGGYDMLLIVENLRLYLESDEIKAAAHGGHLIHSVNRTHQVPLYLGCRLAYLGTVYALVGTLHVCLALPWFHLSFVFFLRRSE
jgi:glycoprotein-N-acetylgalactosamine 3-beta-galactosyltransferase